MELDMGNARVEKQYIFYTAKEVEELPDLEWLIPSILPKPGLGVLFGEPGCCKTFVALSMALSIANGTEWVGRSVQPAKVLFIAAEGVYGLKTRIAAFRQRHGVEGDRIKFMAGSIDVRDKKQIDTLIADLKGMDFEPGLIIVDTLARVTVGADENNAKDMGQAVQGLDELKTAFNASVLVIHHTVKHGKSFRGSSALSGAADVMIFCAKSDAVDSAGITLECEKMKDEEHFKPISVKLDKVQLPLGKSSLVLGDIFEPTKLFEGLHTENIIQLLRDEFGESGALNSELLKAFLASNFGSKSTFDREMKKMRNAGKIKEVKDGNRNRYFPLSVGAK